MLERSVSRTTREIETCQEVSRMVELYTTLPNYKLWIVDEIQILYMTQECIQHYKLESIVSRTIAE